MLGQMCQSFSLKKKKKKKFILLYFLFIYFLADPYKILVPQGGTKPMPPHWGRGVLTTGPSGKSETFTFLKENLSIK